MNTTRRMIFRSILLLPILMTVCFIGCGDDDNGAGPEEADYTTELRAGWRSFSDQNWNVALEHFLLAIELNDQEMEAYSGAGWTEYKLGNGSAAEAYWEDGYIVGLTASDDLNNIRAGLGLYEFDNEDYSTAVNWFEELIENNPSYTFEHFEGFDAADIIWGLCESYYLLSNYESSLDWVQRLNPVFTADIATAQGRLDLAQEIERLYVVVGG